MSVRFALFLAFLLFSLSTTGFSKELIDATGAKITVPEKPSRVVTLAPSLGELAADILGSELSRIVGVSEYTDYPPALEKVKTIGPYHRFNLESVMGLKPDLVLATTDGNAKDQIDHLREERVPVLVISTRNFEEVEQSMRLVGRALGDEERGKQMAAQFRSGVDRIRKRCQERAARLGKPKVMLQVGDDPLVVAGSGSFLQHAVEAIAAENVYQDLKPAYPRPMWEDAISRNPERILIVTMGKDLRPYQVIAKRWKEFPRLKAVKAKEIHILQGDMILRPSLRLLEGLGMMERVIWHEQKQ